MNGILNRAKYLSEEIVHMPEMITDERFLTVPLRVQNNEAQKKLIESWSKQYTVDEIVGRTLEKGIPAGPIYNLKQIVEDPHIPGAREMFPEIDHAVIGRMKVTGNPIKLMETMPRVEKSGPVLGQHNACVYSGMLGVAPEELEQLTKNGVI